MDKDLHLGDIYLTLIYTAKEIHKYLFYWKVKQLWNLSAMLKCFILNLFGIFLYLVV